MPTGMAAASCRQWDYICTPPVLTKFAIYCGGAMILVYFLAYLYYLHRAFSMLRSPAPTPASAWATSCCACRHAGPLHVLPIHAAGRNVLCFNNTSVRFCDMQPRVGTGGCALFSKRRWVYGCAGGAHS